MGQLNAHATLVYAIPGLGARPPRTTASWWAPQVGDETIHPGRTRSGLHGPPLLGPWLSRHTELHAGADAKSAWRENRRGVVQPLSLAAGVALASGAALFVTTNRAEAWQSNSAGKLWKADYERQYRRLHGEPDKNLSPPFIRLNLSISAP